MADTAPSATDDAPSMQYLTYKCRLLPTRGQHRRLADMLEHTRQIYNACLQHRLEAWDHACRWDHDVERITAVSQQRDLTVIRAADPTFATYPRRLQAWAIDLVDTSFKSFFALRKNELASARRPRFRGHEFWNTWAYNSPIECRINGLYLRLPGMRRWVRMRMHRPLPEGMMKFVKLVREGARWFVHITIAVPSQTPPSAPRKPVGIDLGLKVLATCSDGTGFANPRISNGIQRELRVAGRGLARRKKGSRGRMKARRHLRRLQQKAMHRRREHAHKVSAEIVRRYDAIAVEKLNVKGLSELRSPNDGKRGRSLRRNVRDAALGDLLAKLEWKARRDGCLFVAVDPKGTTQDCSGCGVTVPKTLCDRVHDCPRCGLVLDRDINAARNVRIRAGWVPGDAKVGAASAARPALSRKQPRTHRRSLRDQAGPSPVPSPLAGLGRGDYAAISGR